MKIQTEPIASIPRPKFLVNALNAFSQQQIDKAELSKLYDEALKDTIHRFEETGSPVITDGEQTKPSFATYPIMGMKQLDPNGVIIPFAEIIRDNCLRSPQDLFAIRLMPIHILKKQSSLQTCLLNKR